LPVNFNATDHQQFPTQCGTQVKKMRAYYGKKRNFLEAKNLLQKRNNQ